jgi:hypothetical protein
MLDEDRGAPHFSQFGQITFESRGFGIVPIGPSGRADVQPAETFEPRDDPYGVCVAHGVGAAFLHERMVEEGLAWVNGRAIYKPTNSLAPHLTMRYVSATRAHCIVLVAWSGQVPGSEWGAICAASSD